jgi:hypothetical protein
MRLFVSLSLCLWLLSPLWSCGADGLGQSVRERSELRVELAKLQARVAQQEADLKKEKVRCFSDSL